MKIATGCTHDTNIQHLHDETNILPIYQHLQHPTHPLHKLTIHPHTPRLKKQTTFNNINYTTNIDTHPNTVTQQQITANSTQIHTSIVHTYLIQHNHNKLIQQIAPKISLSEISLSTETRHTLAQLRTNKSPILMSYLHKVDETHYPSPLCKTHPHTTEHLLNCTHLYTWSNIMDLWMSPRRVVPLLARWKGRLVGLPWILGLSDSSTATRRRGRSTTTTTVIGRPIWQMVLKTFFHTNHREMNTITKPNKFDKHHTDKWWKQTHKINTDIRLWTKTDENVPSI